MFFSSARGLLATCCEASFFHHVVDLLFYWLLMVVGSLSKSNVDDLLIFIFIITFSGMKLVLVCHWFWDGWLYDSWRSFDSVSNCFYNELHIFTHGKQIIYYLYDLFNTCFGINVWWVLVSNLAPFGRPFGNKSHVLGDRFFIILGIVLLSVLNMAPKRSNITWILRE